MFDMRQINRMMDAVKSHLSDRAPHQGAACHLSGNCYVQAEALHHLLGGEQTGWVPHTLQVDGGPHWFLRHKHSGTILDPTRPETPLSYDQGKFTAFLTKQPSKRTQVVLNRIAGDHDPVSKSEDFDKAVLDPNSGYRFEHKAIPMTNHYGTTPESRYYNIHQVSAFAPNGEEIGRATFNHDKASNTLETGNTFVHENHRRKGIASAMYSHAEKATGMKIIPSKAQSKDAQALWAANSANKQFGKSESSADHSTKTAASIAVFNSEGHLLMGQRNDSKRWTLPGGKMDVGELPEECARRELQEEAGLQAKRLKFLGRGVGGKDSDWTVYSFEAHCDDKPDAGNDPDKECDSWEWIPVADGLPKEISNQLHNRDRDVTLQLLGLQSGSLEPTELSKGLKHRFLGAIAAAGLAMSPQALAGEPDKKPSLSGLHHELHPIAQLESSGGKNINHKPHSLGEFHTAVGAVGLKPSTAHDEYMKSSWLQKVFPNISDPQKFTHEFKRNDALYNHTATSHWHRLKKLFGGDTTKAAYAWRWGQGAALRDAPEVQAGDPYVQAYQKLTSKARAAAMGRHLINPLSKEEVDKWTSMGSKPSKAKSLRTFDHYSMQPGLKELDPKFQGTGSVGPEKGRPKRIPRVYMYAADTAPEQHVAAASRAKYRVELPAAAKFYDMGADELGLLEPKMRSTKYGQFYEPADLDEVERKIKRLGYHGYHNYMSTAPNAYAVFTKVKAKELKKTESSTDHLSKVEPWFQAMLAQNEARKQKINELVQTTRGSVWASRNGGHLVVGKDPHDRSRWRVTPIQSDGTPTSHTVAPDHTEALKTAHSLGANLLDEPVKKLPL